MDKVQKPRNSMKILYFSEYTYVTGYLLSGLLLRGFTERRHERLRGVLPSNQRNDLLVSQSIL
jgi:hypothetical protein